MTECKECNGTGALWYGDGERHMYHTCHHCDGTGLVNKLLNQGLEKIK